MYIHLFIYSPIHLFSYSFIHLFIYSFVHLFIYSFIHLFIYSFIHSLIYLFIYLSFQTLNSISAEKNSTIIFPLPIGQCVHFILFYPAFLRLFPEISVNFAMGSFCVNNEILNSLKFAIVGQVYKN